MLPLFITIDTEYSSGFFARGIARDCQSNFDAAIACKGEKAEAGIHYQMDVFDRHGLKAVFFVDPMPALVWGQKAVDAVVQPILKRGHDVQLHLHTEWLSFAKDNPLGTRTGQHLKNFSFDEQCILIDYAMTRLMAAGAARPVAFRAGNYGANDDSLRALAQFGIACDTSFPPAMSGADCEISLTSSTFWPQMHCDVLELPIGAIAARAGGQRHAQITALSRAELCAAVSHAAADHWPAFVIVSHSFEMFNREKRKPNRIVMRRFEAFCAWLERRADIRTATFADSSGMALDRPDEAHVQSSATLLPHNALRTGFRVAEQIAGRLFY